MQLKEVAMSPRRLSDLVIVIVDDESDVRSAIARYLASLGAVVEICQNVDEAISAIRRARPDLVLSDLAMPGRDGFELLQEIRSLDRSERRDTPVIAITGLGRDIDRARLPLAGFNAILRKPFTPDALLRAITELLEL
jgi:CheY-like chemotaxis protein